MNKMLCYFLFLVILAVSDNQTFGQYIWTKDARNPILSGGGEGTWNKHVGLPSVLFNNDSTRFEMWFGAFEAPFLRPYYIGFAVSEDGITWTMHNTPVLSPTPDYWDESTVENQTVIRENGQYKMWYSGWSGMGKGYIGYATSTNGINWTKRDSVFGPGTSEWEAGGPFGCEIMPVIDGYKMWYGGYTADYNLNEIGYATSTDGIVWQRDTVNNPVLKKGGAGQWDDEWVMPSQVLLIDTTFYMWYTGTQGVYPDYISQIGLATSQDGIHWTKYINNPVLAVSPGEWDEGVIEGGTVLLLGDTLHMWYSGTSDPFSTLFEIGHATSPLQPPPPDNVTEPGIIPKYFSLKQNYPNPFNPTTNIEYRIPNNGFVTLSIYNILGEKVATLVNGIKSAGIHSIEWNADNVSSGVYFYRLETEDYCSVKKMVVIK